MGEALVFKCETASRRADGSVVTFGECLLGPIRVGDAVAQILRDVDSPESVALSVVGVRSRTIPTGELRTDSWGELHIEGPDANGLRPGDYLIAVPPVGPRPGADRT